VNRLGRVYDRLSGVQVEQRDAIEAIQYWDGSHSVLYVDPPYVHDTRVDAEYYAHEMSNDQHELMIDALLECRGHVVVSGYDHPIYNRFDDSGWERVEFKRLTTMTASQRGKEDDWDREIKPRGERVEVVWLNNKAHSVKKDPTLWDTL
jgi:DNA adenine methylase